jgi:hypothetical protein
MLRVAFGSGLFAVGYLLLYAAVDSGGAYALRPWDALSPSAPWPSPPGADQTSTAGGSGGGGGGVGGLLGKVGSVIGKVRSFLSFLGP